MKRILGLDLGTNSIGWAVVNEAENNNEYFLVHHSALDLVVCKFLLGKHCLYQWQ